MTASLSLPGIDLKYDSVPGWGKEHETKMPHAWKAGEQTKILKAQLDAVPDGGTIVMIAPPNPYRCPPGPYERVSMMAHTLKAAGKTKAKIVIIDPKKTFLQAGPVPGRLGKILSGHGRMDCAGYSLRHQVGRSGKP